MTQLPPSAQQSGYGGSQSYIWSPKRLLGKGTSGHIYRGWDKKTAKKCAVKEFKATASKHAMREVEVIRHLSHPHIVRVMGIETNSRTGENILVMEYCDGGSLYSKIREPENFYGLPEEELLRVVVHISSGLEYLHQNNIVHRDIKPGNIMCTTTKDGTSYKLSDFGTAKVLKTTESHSSDEFPTLQGTEEYMHPELIEGLVYRDSSGYTIKADMYSLGITIYQAATGSLPFMVPGGRQDKEGRVKLIAQKPRGMISGFIDPFGKAKWESELPATCRISRSLKNILEDILANVLEQDPKRAWSFETYFLTIDQLRSNVVLHVFVVRTCAHHRIYLEPTCRLRHLQDKLAALEDVPVEDQVLLYGECLLQDIIGPERKVIDYRPTSEKHPINFLQGSEMTKLKASLVLPPTPKLQTLPENVDLEKDYSNGREFMAAAHYVKREAEKLEMKFILLCQVVLSYGFFVLRNTSYRKQIALQFNNLWEETNVKIQQGRAFCGALLSRCGSTHDGANMHRNGYSDKPAIKETYLREDVKRCSPYYDYPYYDNLAKGRPPKQATTVDNKYLLYIVQKFKERPEDAEIVDGLRGNNVGGIGGGLWNLAGILWSGPKTVSGIASGPERLEEMNSLVREATARFEEIKANQQKKTLDKNEKQIHVVERYHLRKAASDSVQLLNRQFVDPLVAYHAECISQLRELNEKKQKMDRLEKLVMSREEERQRLSAEWNQSFERIFQPQPDFEKRPHMLSSNGEPGDFAAGILALPAQQSGYVEMDGID